jgi:hypothetical protein
MRRTAWARPLAGALVLLLGLTLVAPAVAASQKQVAPAKPTLAASARAQVAAMKVPPAARAQVGASPSAAKSEKGFFKSPAGVAALVLMTAGTGYMVYSAFHDNDPVHSPFR